jgi:hypothetical protein
MAFAGVLPEIPSFGQSLGRNLGAGISQGIGSAAQFAQQMAMDKYKQEQKNKWAQDLIKSHYGQNEDAQDFEVAKTKNARPKILDMPDEAIAALSLNKETAAFGNILQKQKDAAKSEYQTKMGAQDAFEDMVGLIDKVGYSLLSDPNYSPTKKRERGQFEASKGSLIGIIKDKVNKGVLSNQKFNYIKNELLPSHKDSQEVKIGKLKAVAKELDLDASNLDDLYPDIQPATSEKKPSSTMVKMRGPDGSEQLVPKARVKDAMKAGAVVIK